VQEVIALMRERHIQVLFSANYYDRNQIREIAQRTGATAVIVPENTRGMPGVETYFDLVNTWVTQLVQGFAATATSARDERDRVDVPAVRGRDAARRDPTGSRAARDRARRHFRGPRAGPDGRPRRHDGTAVQDRA